MQNRNPYAPPRAEVADVPASLEAAPALWNPNAAASWSLLFSPIFGAVLHMKNWQSLGEVERAVSSRNWAIGSLVFFIVMTALAVFAPDERTVDRLTRLLGLALLLTWYFASARSQQHYVQERFGKDYPRKGWVKPLLLALLATIGFIAVAGVVGVLIDGPGAA